MQAVNTAPWFKELLAERTPPCVSIYQPVLRTRAPSNENAVQFRDRLDEVREKLGGRQGYGARHARAALAQLESLLDDDSLREGDRDTLAFFASPDYGCVIEIRQPLKQAVVIADSFHVKPLIRLMQQVQRFHVLAVGPRSVRLFEGDPYRLREVQPLRNVPKSVDDPLATNAPMPKPAPASRAAQAAQPSAPAGAIAPDRFFRIVDQAIWENYSRRERIPLIVAADVQYLADFLSQSRNDYVVEEGIPLNPEAATPDRLRDEAWKILQPRLNQQIQTLKDAFCAAKAHQQGSDEIPQVAEAAAQGRVGTLLVDSDLKIPGILHRDSGLIEPAGPGSNRADDILDDLAEIVLKTDGQVLVLPHEQMPTDAGVAAVYRY